MFELCGERPGLEDAAAREHPLVGVGRLEKLYFFCRGVVFAVLQPYVKVLQQLLFCSLCKVREGWGRREAAVS